MWTLNRQNVHEKNMNKNIKNLMKILTQRDFNALKSIYDYRCLSFQQIFDLHYKYSEHKKGTEVTAEYLKKKMARFREAGILEESQCFDGKTPNLFFLSAEGIKIVKEAFDFPENIYDVDKRMHRRGYLTSAELRVSPRFTTHQYHLNSFVIELKNQLGDTPCKYEDEKHIKNFVGIRPDGILTAYDVEFFLEMDMGTENENQLYEKWDHYRRFANSNEFHFKERKIVILFIVDGIAKIKQRKDLIKHTINLRMLDLVDKDMEFYIGTKEELVKAVFEKVIPKEKGEYDKMQKIKYLLNKKCGFNVASGDKVAQFFDNTLYSLYIRRGESEDNNMQEFIVEEFMEESLSTINRVSYLDYKNSFFKEKFKRGISLIVVGDSEQSLYENLNIFNLVNANDVLWTTLERLETMPFNEAIFAFSLTGDIFHFEDDTLGARVFEKHI